MKWQRSESLPDTIYLAIIQFLFDFLFIISAFFHSAASLSNPETSLSEVDLELENRSPVADTATVLWETTLIINGDRCGTLTNHH